MKARTKVIVGNWKMHLAVPEAMALARALKVKLAGVKRVEVGVAPVFTSIPAVIEVLKETAIGVGGQNIHFEEKGAFTGEIAAPMLKDLGCKYVILGHSERRQFFGEKDELVLKKAKSALGHDLVPIICVGELLAEREAGRAESVVETQVKGSLGGLSAEQMAKSIIAYEPVWAIGTGKTATPADAQAMHAFLRGWLGRAFGDAVAQAVRIQYGGSVKADNAKTLLSQPDIDGALVGGASLKAEDFEAIVKAGE